MIFVNEIAKVVHHEVDLYLGAANKNIGDAFQLIWRISQQEVIYDKEIDDLTLKDTIAVNQLCECAVTCFASLLEIIHTSSKVQRFSKNPKLLERLPNYQVRMGFGLHIGWAIEGPIGSDYKIDASYLSPNVNIASRLEAATKQYGSMLLISEGIFKHCSPQVILFFIKIRPKKYFGQQTESL